MEQEKKGSLKADIQGLLIISFILTLTGMIFIYSASSVFALEKFGSSFYFLKKQFIYLIPAIISFIFFATVSLTWLRKYSSLLFIISLFFTVLTLIPYFGVKLHGSNRWLNLFGFGFQPSEFLKFFLLIYIGYFLEKKEKNITSLLNSYIPFLIILGINFLVLLKQPDFGSVVTIFTTALILFFIAEFKLSHLFITLLVTLPAGVFLILTKSYRLNRILIFLNPWSDPLGRGFQIIQSLIAIGSGNIWGVGISNSKQKFFYLPMQHTDFVFSIIAEEIGFIGSSLLIFLFFLFLLFGLRVALKLENSFAFFTTLGFVVLVSLQAVINFMVTSGLLPTKGLGLPFVSYGGTALIALYCMLGLICNFAKEQGM